MEGRVTAMTLGRARDIWSSSNQLVASMLFDRDNDTWFGATIDTRAQCGGKLFFALQGENTDGHRFLLEAARRGGRAVVIQAAPAAGEAAGAGVPYFMVKDTLGALQRLAKEYRNELPARVVAVTGSSGKTTTKELMCRVLGARYRVQSNPGNYNNHIGVPLTILDTAPSSEFLISEVGANHAGEITFICDMLKPDIAVITNIGDAHVGHFGGRDNVARAKAELLDGIPASGYALLPGDDEFLPFLKNKAPGKTITFGFSESCDFRIEEFEPREEGSFFRVNGTALRVRLMGAHNALNVAAALALGSAEGVNWETAVGALEQAEPLEGRGRIIRGGGITLLDDAYNANPSSMKASFAVMEHIAASRRIAVLGDMMELGAFSERYHRALGEHIGAGGFDLVFWLGDAAADVRAGLAEAGVRCEFRAFRDPEELAEAVAGEIRPGDAVLVKGSHACRLDRVVTAVRAMIDTGGGR
jgi:UDP-N-acetylmuramoyl-tripeptide--D-alanyl-D-alanine ligase